MEHFRLTYRKIKTRFALAVLALALSLSARGQMYTRHTLPTIPLMPTPQVSSVHIDAEGYAWYGTWAGGLLRDDGYHIDVLPVPGDILHIHYGAGRRLWVGTGQGLYVVQRDSGYAVQPVLDYGRVSTLHVCPDSSLWVGCGTHILHLSATGQVLWQAQAPDATDATQWANHIIADSHGDIWMAEHPCNISRYDNSLQRFVRQPWPNWLEPINMAPDSTRGGLWVGTWGDGVVWYDGHSVSHPLDTPRDKQDDLQNRLQTLQVLLHDSTLWVMTMQGLEAYRLSGKGATLHGTAIDLSSLSLPQRQILCQLDLDHQGRLWVASFSPSPFVATCQQPQPNLSLPSMTIGRAVWSAPYLYTWNNRNDLNLLDIGTGDVTTVMQHCPDVVRWSSEAMSPCRDGSGVWSLHTLANGDSTRVSRISATANGDVTIDSLTTIAGRGVCVAECADGHLWVPITSDSIEYLLPQGDSLMWVATSSGTVMHIPMSQARSTTWRQHTTTVLTVEGHIMSMTIDSIGHLWVATPAMAVECNPHTGTRRSLHTTSAQIGLSYISSVCTTPLGVVVCGVGGSPTLHQPVPSLDHPQHKLVLHVSALTIDSDTPILYDPSAQPPHISVSPDTRSIVLRLSTLNHLEADQLTYGYRLRHSGADTTWTWLPTGHNQVYLTGLSRGQWPVEVCVRSPYGICGPAVRVLDIWRRPAWWETGWALAIYILLVATITVYVLRVWHYVRRLQRAYRLSLERRRRIYLHSVEVKTSSITPKDEGEELLRRAVEAVESHLADNAYDMHRLASDLCMSRMTLYRRLHLLVGQSSADFIRSIRLKNAARLLRQHPSMSVTEVSEAVGFNTPAAFRTAFRAMFGTSPSNYR